MERDAKYATLALFAIACVAAAVAFVWWYSGRGDQRDYKTYEIYFQGTVSGLSKGSPVRYLGVDVGRVQNLTVNRRDPGRVKIVVDVDSETPLSGATRARLGLPDRPAIGILGTLRNWKGHTYLFEAFASLQASHPDWQLIVIGDGPQRRNLERLAPELGLDGRLRMVGNRDDVPDWLQALDLMALPSYGEEGVPQSVMQGMACALPVVSTPVGAIAEAVDDGQTGLLVPPRDAAALAAALARLMDDAPLRERFGQQGLARARERFGIDIMIERMEAIFLRHARPAGSA